MYFSCVEARFAFFTETANERPELGAERFLAEAYGLVDALRRVPWFLLGRITERLVKAIV